MKHPVLRVASVLDVDSSFIDELEALGRGIIALLPSGVVPVDLEWCGSYANNSAMLHSDIDLAMPMADWNSQILLRRLLSEKIKLISDVRALVNGFSDKWGVTRLDFNPVVPDNKESAVKNKFAVYSVFERKLYGTPIDLKAWYLVMDPYTQRYRPRRYDDAGVAVYTKVEAMPNLTPMRWAYDEWAADGSTAHWKSVYGSKFQEPIVVTKPDGSTEFREF
jgi:hypothetical protein